MKRVPLQVVYWCLCCAFVVGALLAGLRHAWHRDGYGYPLQGLAVACGVLGATFALLADRARRDGSSQHSPGE